MLQSVTNKGMASYQLLGDIVNSRAVDDRSRLHRDVVGALGAGCVGAVCYLLRQPAKIVPHQPENRLFGTRCQI